DRQDDEAAEEQQVQRAAKRALPDTALAKDVDEEAVEPDTGAPLALAGGALAPEAVAKPDGPCAGGEAGGDERGEERSHPGRDVAEDLAGGGGAIHLRLAAGGGRPRRARGRPGRDRRPGRRWRPGRSARRGPC